MLINSLNNRSIKMKKIIIICIHLLVFQNLTSQEIIAFEGQEIIIEGWARNLAIVGTYKDEIKVEEEEPDEKKAYNIKVNGPVALISLKPTCHNIAIHVPKTANIKISMMDVVFETKFDRYKGSDWRSIAISKIDGNVESSTDGYNIAIDRVKGSISVVSYGNISAVLPDLANSELVSLDTYWGNVYAKIPSEISASVTLTAKNGKVELPKGVMFKKTEKKTKRKFRGSLDSGLLPIILHSEDGKEVTLEQH